MRLTATNLRFAYADGTVLGPLNLSADRGVVHISGVNGSGKTTLMRVLGGVLPKTLGTLDLDGHDPFEHAPTRAYIGACTPSPELPGFLTATETWRSWAAFRGKPDWQGGPFLEGLDLPANLRLDQMSSGQRRRAELVAALAGDPPVLLLDETFAHLDDAGVDWLITTIESLRGDRLILLAHHGTLSLTADQVIDLPSARRPTSA